MKIVLAGDGEVGMYLAQELSKEDHEITMVLPDSELAESIQGYTDVIAIEGDPTFISVLKRMNVKKADLMISALHDERINLLSAAIAKKLGAKKVIARINNLEYLSDENTNLFLNLGVDSLVCPEYIAAKEVIDLLKQTAATEIFDFSDGKLSLFLIKLDEKARVLEKSLNQIASEYSHLDFRAVAIHRNGETIIPKGDHVFRANDLAYVITKPEGIDALLNLGGKTRIDIRNVMLVGGGRVGRTVARQLEHQLNLKIIEYNKDKALQLANQLDTALVIQGDARDIQLLEEEDIRGMDAFVALTDNSETNILSCLNAKRFGVKRTIALVENIDYIDISQNIGIDTIVCKKLSTASYIIKYTMNAEVTSIKCLSGINAEVLELVAKPHSLVTRKPIRDLKFPRGAIIGGIVRDEESYIAVGDLLIQEGDKVVVFALPEAIHKVDEFFDS
jgi:trk system potassium uptake protein TrkA